MKIVSFLIFLIPAFAFSQSLSFDDLIKFQKSDFVITNDLIIAKNWEFSHSKKGELDNYNTVTWAFQKNVYKEATAWLTLYTAEESKNILSYQMHSAKTYNQIKNQINAYKMKLLSNSIGDNEISSIYQGQSLTITISISSSEDKTNPHYIIGMMSNETYDLIKLNKFLESLDQSEKTTNTKYDGEFIYKSKAFSYAAIFKDIGFTDKIYMVPPDNYVYIISELRDNKVRVFCDGKYGYMDKGMLNR